MNLFKKRKKENLLSVQTAASNSAVHPYLSLNSFQPGVRLQRQVYSTVREGVPLIDAAICKLVRLLGTFEIESKNAALKNGFNSFIKSVKVNGTSTGINSFINTYFDQLLTYGMAVGEIVPDYESGEIALLYNASLENVEIGLAKNGYDAEIYTRAEGAALVPCENKDLICLSLLNPEPASVEGTSLLKGLPFVSDILLKIFKSIGSNWERVGNVRFAVTYKPSNDSGAVYSKENAQQIAREWSKAMRDTSRTCDFVSVGDIDIRVIGADNQILDSEIPVRQLLEQIVAKLSVPPFLLGLSWSSTERMSQQQADILTSEMEYYREIINPVINKICGIWQSLNGFNDDYEIIWNNISLLDEVSLAQARYTNAQAMLIEQGGNSNE